MRAILQYCPGAAFSCREHFSTSESYPGGDGLMRSCWASMRNCILPVWKPTVCHMSLIPALSGDESVDLTSQSVWQHQWVPGLLSDYLKKHKMENGWRRPPHWPLVSRHGIHACTLVNIYTLNTHTHHISETTKIGNTCGLWLSTDLLMVSRLCQSNRIMGSPFSRAARSCQSLEHCLPLLWVAKVWLELSVDSSGLCLSH